MQEVLAAAGQCRSDGRYKGRPPKMTPPLQISSPSCKPLWLRIRRQADSEQERPIRCDPSALRVPVLGRLDDHRRPIAPFPSVLQPLPVAAPRLDMLDNLQHGQRIQNLHTIVNEYTRGFLYSPTCCDGGPASADMPKDCDVCSSSAMAYEMGVINLTIKTEYPPACMLVAMKFKNRAYMFLRAD